MTDLPIDLPIKTMTSKVSVGAHERLRELANRNGFLFQDVLSACLLYMPEDELVRILKQQAATLEGMPKSVKAILKNAGNITADQRKILLDTLSAGE